MYHVEVAITRLTIEGEYNGNCLFAGLAIYGGIREDLLFCSNRSFWNMETRYSTKNISHIISPTDDMRLVLYSLENYMSVSASLILTLSLCTGVTINPCEYDAYCAGTLFDVKICKQYLKSFTTPDIQFHLISSKQISVIQSLHKIV